MLTDDTRGRLADAGRRGGLTTIARNGPDAIAARARAGFQARFEREVDPESALDPEERARRARFARKAHMARLSQRSAEARRRDQS